MALTKGTKVSWPMGNPLSPLTVTGTILSDEDGDGNVFIAVDESDPKPVFWCAASTLTLVEE